MGAYELLKRILPEWVRPGSILTREVLRRTRRVVGSGPFRGMRYVDGSVGSALAPKLLGIYERELWEVVDRICRLDCDGIVDIGAAEGYYAVGLSFRLPALQVVAFEETARGRSLLESMAALNGCGDRIRVLGRCEPADLEAALSVCRKPLVICDVEGYEKVLLDPSRVDSLARATLLIETHEYDVPGITALLEARFGSTHRVERIDSTARHPGDYPYRGFWATVLPERYLLSVVSDGRPKGQCWLWAEPRPG